MDRFGSSETNKHIPDFTFHTLWWKQADNTENVLQIEVTVRPLRRNKSHL